MELHPPFAEGAFHVKNDKYLSWRYIPAMHRLPVLSLLTFCIVFIPAVVHAADLSYKGPDYSFSYGDDYELKEYKSAYGTVFAQAIFNKNLGLPEGVLEIRVIHEEAGDILAESAAIAIARRDCAADGPNISIYCTGVLLSTAMQTRELQGYRLLLQEERRDVAAGTTSARIRGPVYVLNERITHGMIMISYNHPDRPQRSHLRLVRQIIRTFVGH